MEPASSDPTIRGAAPEAVRGFPSVVLLRAHESADSAGYAAGAAPGPLAEPVVMDQVTMTFFPGFLVVRPGQVIEWRNSETDAAHNVRVADLQSDSMLFNVGVAQGIPYRHTLDAPGGYFVSCDLHPGMDATILVTDALHYAIAEDDGSFEFRSIPPGAYTVEVWSLDETRRSVRSMDVPSGSVEWDLSSEATLDPADAP